MVGKRTRGFTLVELLIVMAVLVILSAILFPVLARVQERSRRTLCISRLRQLAAAHLLYVQDWEERLPGWDYSQPTGTEQTPRSVYWTQYLQPYLRCETLLHEPSARWPADPPKEYAVLASYALLTWKQGGRRGDPSEPWMRWPGPPLSLAGVVRPAETIQWIDGWTTTRYSLGAVARHDRGMNATFVDGHARWLSEKAFWRVEWDGASGYYWLYYGTADR